MLWQLHSRHLGADRFRFGSEHRRVQAETLVERPHWWAQFRAWFERFDAADWDQQLENDVEAVALDWLAEEALADLTPGRCSEC
jgi:hypothetical protein